VGMAAAVPPAAATTPAGSVVLASHAETSRPCGGHDGLVDCGNADEVGAEGAAARISAGVFAAGAEDGPELLREGDALAGGFLGSEFAERLENSRGHCRRSAGRLRGLRRSGARWGRVRRWFR